MDEVNGRTLLVVDDEKTFRASVAARLAYDGHRIVEAGSAREALARFDDNIDVVLLDYALPDGDGLSVLERMQERAAAVPVIMLTGYGTVERAVEAMRRGAYDFATKPVDLDVVARKVTGALVATAWRHQMHGAAARQIIGASPAMAEAVGLLVRMAQSPGSTILVTGETGTGKDLAARVIHALSSRREGRFVNITCSAIPETLLEGELFGHESGAFTDARTRKPGLLETANNGTVFLDEIGEMGAATQAKLLRFLEEKAFRRVGGTQDIQTDVRVIAATNVDLEEAVKLGAFRRDLYYRLAVLRVNLPPLRERGDDVRLLAQHFVDRFQREFGKRVTISPAALELLAAQRWPGNVRELRNVTERAVLLAERSVVGPLDFKRGLAAGEDSGGGGVVRLPSAGLDLRTLERDLVVQALEACGGNRTRAARMLGLTRDQVRYRASKFSIPPKANGEGDG